MNVNGFLINNNNKPVHKTAAKNMTVPTQIDAPTQEADIIPSAASKAVTTKAVNALKAQTLAQAPLNYNYIGEIKMPFSQNAQLYKLATGQRVIILPKKGPTVIKSYFNVGSMNEPDEKRGISHFVEHMMFNGTENGLAPGDFFKITNKMGALTNASTGFSQTDYFIASQLLNQGDFEQALTLHADMLQSPKYAPEMVEKEKGPVTSEISMVGDQPENKAMNNCIKNLFQIKTSSNDLIAGNISNINNLSRDDAYSYYNLWYTPDNCTTVITGEVNPQIVIDQVAKNFNKFKAPKIQNRKYEDLTPINNPVRNDIKIPKAQSSTIVMGFVGPQNSSTKENITLELLMTALLGYKNARLSKPLNKIQSSAMMNVERISNRQNDPKAIMLASQCSPNKTEEVIRTIYDGISELSTKPLNEDELEKAKKNLKISFSKVSENSHMLNTLLGTSALDNDLSYISNYLPILDSITAQDVTNFARKYLDLNKVSLTVVHPATISDEAIKSNYENINTPTNFKNNKISFKGNITSKSFDTSRIEQYKLSNNMELVLNANDSDIAATKIVLDTIIPANVKPTVPAILSVILNEGTLNKNYDTFYEPIQKSGMEFKLDSNFHSITATVDSLSQDMPKALEYIKEVLENPRFTQASFNYARKLVEEAILNTPETSTQNTLKKLFPHMPEFSSKQELLDSLKETSLEDVKNFYNYLLENAQAKGIITAPFEKRQNLKNEVFEKLSDNRKVFQQFKVDHFKTYTPIEKDIIQTKAEPGNQADIVQAFKFKTNFNPKDQISFYVLNTILGDGPNSRLFNDLREKQKLAYRVGSYLDFVGNTGIVSLEIKTTTDDQTENIIQYDNVEKSLEGFKKHIQQLMKEYVTEEELNAAKNSIKTKLLNSIESSSGQTDVLSNSKDSIFGITATNENLKLVDEVTPQDVLNVANYIFNSKSITSIQASQNTLDNIKIKATEN